MRYGTGHYLHILSLKCPLHEAMLLIGYPEEGGVGEGSLDAPKVLNEGHHAPYVSHSSYSNEMLPHGNAPSAVQRQRPHSTLLMRALLPSSPAVGFLSEHPSCSVQTVNHFTQSYAPLKVKQTIIRCTAYNVWDNSRLCCWNSLPISRHLSRHTSKSTESITGVHSGYPLL